MFDVTSSASNKPKRLRFNLRKLSELPYHLTLSNNSFQLKEQVLFNYEWLYTKLQAMSLHDVITDFRQADEYLRSQRVPPEDDIAEIRILETCLRIGASSIRDCPDALSFELIGRLLPYYEQYPVIRSLIQQCDTKGLRHNHLVPLFQSFEAPKGSLKYILEDSKLQTIDVKFSKYSKELVSVTKDGTVSFWSMQTGENTRTFPIPNLAGAHINLLQSRDGRYLVVESDKVDSPVFIIDVQTLELAHKLDRRSNQSKRCFVVGDTMVRQKALYNIKTGQQVGHLDDFIKSNSFLPCVITPNEQYILIASHSSSSGDGVYRLHQFELSTQVNRMIFESATSPHSFAITPDSRYCYVGYDRDCLFRVLCVDPEHADFGKTLFVFDSIAEYRDLREEQVVTQRLANELTSIAISPRDQNLVLLNFKRSQLIVLNVKSRKHKKLNISQVSERK